MQTTISYFIEEHTALETSGNFPKQIMVNVMTTQSENKLLCHDYSRNESISGNIEVKSLRTTGLLRVNLTKRQDFPFP